MKCNQCGREIPEDSRFCAYCGCKIEKAEADYILPTVKKPAAPGQAAAPEGAPQPQRTEQSVPVADEPAAPADAPAGKPADSDPAQARTGHRVPRPERKNPVLGGKKKPEASQQPTMRLNGNPVNKPQLETDGEDVTLWDVLTGKFFGLWDKLDWCLRGCLILGVVSLLLLLVSLILGKTPAAVFSVLQLAAALAVTLMHGGVFKLPPERKNIPYLVLAGAVLLLLLNLWSFSWGGGKPKPAPTPTPAPTPVATPAATTVQAPFAEENCIGQNYAEIQAAFEAAGFRRVNVQPIEDLLFDQQDQIDTVESVSINDGRAFAQQQNFDPEDVVVIRYHVYKKCQVSFHADVKENFLFSKYDVDVFIDTVYRDTIVHGSGADFTFALEPGLHTLTFQKAESTEPAGQVTMEVHGDVNAQFQLVCRRQALEVETVFLTDLGEVDENHAMLPDTMFTVKEFAVEMLMQEFDIAGFTNVTLEPVYDADPDSQEMDKVISVSVGGVSDFVRGQVVAKDTPIVIQYHASKADAPAESAQPAEPAV